MRVVLSWERATSRLLAAVLLVALTGCGADPTGGDQDGGGASVVVTTTILGDIVRAVAPEGVDVDVLLPVGADPHDFSPSTRQAEAMADADLLVVNGAGIEAGLDDAVAVAADAGVAVFDLSEHVELLGDDPHVWMDPRRMAPAIVELAGRIAGLVPGASTGRADAYVADLGALDTEIDALLADLPDDRRVLVTNHEVLGYFADRYDLEVVGAVIPSLTTGAAASAADLDALARTIEDRDVPAIFAETSSPTRLADALAGTLERRVEVVELFTESLSPPDGPAPTYLDLLRTDAERIHTALLGVANGDGT